MNPRHHHPGHPRGFRCAAFGAVAVVVMAGASGLACRQDMHDKGRIKPFEESRYFADGRGARVPPAGTVARGFLRDDVGLYKGQTADGDFLAEIPGPVTRERLVRGQSRFDIFCAPCHGRLGSGEGMIVQRGYKKAASFHDPRLRAAPAGYIFDVMTNGFGQMPSYTAQITPEDRWAIVAYVRALQLSQNVPAEMLTTDDRRSIDSHGASRGASDAAPAAPRHGGH